MPKRSTRVLRQHSQRPAKTLMSQTKRYSEFTLQINSSQKRIYTIRWTKVFCPADGFGLADEHSLDLIIVHMEILSDITPRLTNLTKCVAAILIEIKGLPEPNCLPTLRPVAFGKRDPRQYSISDLQQNKVSLDIGVLHPVFATFLHDVGSMCLTEWAPDDDVERSVPRELLRTR